MQRFYIIGNKEYYIQHIEGVYRKVELEDVKNNDMTQMFRLNPFVSDEVYELQENKIFAYCVKQNKMKEVTDFLKGRYSESIFDMFVNGEKLYVILARTCSRYIYTQLTKLPAIVNKGAAERLDRARRLWKKRTRDRNLKELQKTGIERKKIPHASE